MQNRNDEGRPRKPATKRPRSLGSLILLMTVLLVIFLVLNQAQQSPEAQFNQDRFWFYLRTGRIEETKFHGSSQIRGTYRDDSGKSKPYTVLFHDLSKNDELIRDLKAKPAPVGLSLDDFLAKAGWSGSNDSRQGGYEPPPGFRLLEGQEITYYLPVTGGEDGHKRELQRSFLVTARIDGEEERFRVESSRGGVDLDKADMDRLEKLWDEYNESLQAASPTLAAGGVSPAARAVWKPMLSFDLTDRGTELFEENNLWTQVLVSFAPWVIILLVFYFFIIRQMRAPGGGGGILSFGRSRAVLYSKENRTNVTFEDVAGVEEAKEDVAEIIEFLKNPQRFQRLGGRIPRGILLAGPPGTGKTLLAKAIAGEAEVPFFSISGSDFVEMFVGVGASRVRDLFRQAKENSPCIVFLDEIDAVGRKRGAGLGGGHDEREQTLNAILVEMDGFHTDEGIIICAATNRPDVLDPALLRPGRFDREIVIDMPDLHGRKAILKVHARNVKINPAIDLEVIARATPGFSGADLAAVINEGAILAVMNNHDRVQLSDLEEARDKIRFGRQKRSRHMDVEDRKIIAYHESGHALVATLLEHAEPVHKVTIIPRGMALGSTMTLPKKDQYFLQRRKLEDDLAVLYGGRIAEKIFCGDISAGAQNDILHATHMARMMVCEWGMSEKIGPVSYAEREGSEFLGQEFKLGKSYSDETAQDIDSEVRGILQTAYDQAHEVIVKQRENVQLIADGLMRYETLSGEEIQLILDGGNLEEHRKAEEVKRRAENAAAAKECEQAALPGESPPAEEPSGLSGEEGLSPA